MWHRNRWMIAVLIIVTALTLTACAAQASQTSTGSTSSPPARVERMGETDLSRVILTAQAAKRLGIETAPVRDIQVQGKLRKVVPYAAVFYDLNGKTWVSQSHGIHPFEVGQTARLYVDVDHSFFFGADEALIGGRA